MTDNPLLDQSGLPRFDAIEARHVVAAIETQLQIADEGFDRAEQSAAPEWQSAVAAVTDAIEPLQLAWSVVTHLSAVKDSPDLRAAKQSMEPKVVEMFLRIDQSGAIYRALKQLETSDDWASLSRGQQRVVETRVLDAELSGIGLEGQSRARFNEIETRLAALGTQFSNNVLDSIKAYSLLLTDPSAVEGMPATWRRLAAQAAGRASQKDDQAATDPDAGPWLVTLEAPIAGPFLMHCRDASLREEVYRAQITHASFGDTDNRPVIEEILALRHEKAALLGYENYAQVSLKTKMAGTPEAVRRLNDEVRGPARSRAEAEIAELREFARESTGDPSLVLNNWDHAFWGERMRETRFGFTDEDLRPYFPFPQVLQGLFDFTQRMFGVKVAPADGDTSVWDPGVRFFRVYDDADQQIAAFYLDPYVRPENKRPGAWMDNAIDRRLMPDGTIRLPVAYLNCNQTPPTADVPSLMTLAEVTTLFHEFGHGLQHMLTTIDFPEGSGLNNIEWDAIEIASRFIQYWVHHPPTLGSIAQHHITGAPLPEELFDKIEAARTFQSGQLYMRQLYLSEMDLDLHEVYERGVHTVDELKAEAARRNLVIAPLPEDRFECHFGHIFAGPYAAGYYSYLWAAVLAADAFAAFEEVGPEEENRSRIGRRFKDTFFSLGGAEHPMEVFRMFRGRDPRTDALLKLSGLR